MKSYAKSAKIAILGKAFIANLFDIEDILRSVGTDYETLDVI